VDILETEDAILLKADIPDVKIEDIDIRVENNTLTLRGHRKFEKDEKVKGWHRSSAATANSSAASRFRTRSTPKRSGPTIRTESWS
jgi:HSP20 family molecular chaperone IbpA